MNNQIKQSAFPAILNAKITLTVIMRNALNVPFKLKTQIAKSQVIHAWTLNAFVEWELKYAKVEKRAYKVLANQWNATATNNVKDRM